VTAGTLVASTILVGDYVSIPAVIDRSVPDVVHLLVADHQRHPFWVRSEDVDARRGQFQGRVVAVWPEHLELVVCSATDEHYLTVPAHVASVLPHEESLQPCHLCRPVDSSEPIWLYDGEAFYPVDSFPAGALDRDQVPPRLRDLGHLRNV